MTMTMTMTTATMTMTTTTLMMTMRKTISLEEYVWEYSLGEHWGLSTSEWPKVPPHCALVAMWMTPTTVITMMMSAMTMRVLMAMTVRYKGETQSGSNPLKMQDANTIW